MKYFTSGRERRLWLWVAVVVVAIYSTLGLARILADRLGEGLLSDLFFLGLFLIAGAILSQVIKRRTRGIEVGVVLGVTAVYLLVFARMASAAERSHIIEYSVVAIFILEALRERVSQGRRVTFPPLLAIVATTFIGVVDECIQLFLPSRVFDLFDILFDFLASVMAVSASVALTWARRRVERAIIRRGKSPNESPSENRD